MRYIRERDEFLKRIKNIELMLENENAGPFANDIPWGDSLVGRLINAIRRKIGVGTNILNINKLIKKLRTEFEQILANAQVGDLTDEQKKMIGMCILYEILLIIKIAIYEKYNKGFTNDDGNPTKIEDKDYLKEVESIVTEAIEIISTEADEYIIENSEQVVTELKKLVELIKKLKLEEVKPEEKEEENKGLTLDDIVIGKEYYYEGKKGKRIVKVVNKEKEIRSPGDDKTWMTDDDKIGDDISTNLQTKEKQVYVLPRLEDGKYPIKPMSGHAVEISKLSEIPDNQKEKKLITSGTASTPQHAATANVPSKHGENKEKENTNVTHKPQTKEEVPNGVKVQTKTDSSGLSQNSSRKYLFDYEEFMNDAVTVSNAFNKIENGENSRKEEEITDKEEEKPENINDDTTKEEKSEGKSNQEQLKEFWEINFIQTKLMKTKEEIEKLKIEVDKIQGEDKDTLTINGIDPVIELVKLFNRAYKIHTHGVIPGARSHGKVARGVWDQYTAFGNSGGGEPNAITQGPYRNNKVFNIWENAVLDIMKERKFEKIFDPKTKLRVGNKMKEGAGALLRKLITDFLDGEKLYKGGKEAGGVQKEFLDKYFGEVAGDEIKNANLGFGKNEVADNAKLSDKIPTINLKFEKIDLPKDFRRMFFRIKGKDGDNLDTTKYFFIQEVKANIIYLVYSKTFGDFKKYILFGLKDDKGELNPIPSFVAINDAVDQVYATKITKEKLIKLIRGEEQVELTGKNTNKEEKQTKLKAVESTLWLMNTDKKELFKLLKFNFFDAKAKGFHTPESNNDNKSKEWGETK